MGLPLRFTKNADEEIKAANYPDIRFFTVGGHPACHHVDVIDGGWRVVSPETASWISAVGYYFARKVEQEMHIPIGIVVDSAGGTPAEAKGTHFAPSLIGITKKYLPAQLTDLLHHPKKQMRAGGMPAVTVNDAQMKQLVAYLSGLGTEPAKEPVAAAQAAQPAPAKPASPAEAGKATTPAVTPQAAKPVPLSADAVRGKELFEHNRCETCHGVDGLRGTVAAPGLAGLASVLPASVLDNLLQHHSTQMKNGNMPPTNMNPGARKAIVAYIRSMPSPPDTQ
jgi:mono/diheme cytochrome c family protein